MRKIILFLLPFFLCVVAVNAQTIEATRDAALQLAVKNSIGIGLSSTEMSNVVVSDAYFDKSSGLNMVYLQQTYKSIPVYNQIMVLAFKNGVLLSSAGKYNHSIEKFVNVQSAVPNISAEAAVVAAISDRKLITTESAVALKVKNNGQKIEFGNLGVSRENITAQLMWVPSSNEKVVNLSWQIYIIPLKNSDYWLVRMDATNNTLLGADNLTVYCNWGDKKHVHKTGEKHNSNAEITSSNYKPLFNFEASIKTTSDKPSSPTIINSSTYRVIPYPAESPQSVGGAHALRTDPWTAAPGNATTLKWHTGLAGVDFDYTRGNNVWAYQDRVAPLNTGSVAKSTTSTTALPNLTFDFTPNYTVTPLQTTPAPNVQFNTTNVFYWNNIIHDVLYQYGFDEVSGNFQDDNLSRGGAGNDHVNAEAQDASGTNNANFSTPADGASGRMQMFLFDINGSNPQKDGDADNGIVVHEFGHGLSNRLTGGPSNVSCLNNIESMGEGWSDYYALMFTTNWATATLSDGFNIPRPLGLYALNNVNLFPASPPNSGIRRFAYSTNLAVNPLVYAATIPAETHDLGEIWCAVIWDMTWAIINQVGVINPNIYDISGGGGNNIAMKLVTEGLKLQQCSPGFISGRNAILQADLNLYGGTYRCAIIAAFARRGMGTNASEGSTTSVTDQVADFSGGGPSLLLSQNGTVSVSEGQNIIYNNKVVAECAAVSNYVIRDTLPLNVSFVSANNGGTYNPVNRVVSWPVTLAANATGNYGFTVNINTGAYFPPLVLINEPVTTTTIPAFWTATSTTASVWSAHNLRSKSAPNSFFTPNSAGVSDQIIATTASFATGATPPTLSFWHWYNSESTFDGGVLEISTNGGGAWADIGTANIIQNGYNGTISSAFSNPIGGRQAWTGNSNAFIESKVNLTAFASQPTVKLRWRFGTDNSVAATGWNVDDITLQTIAVVNMRSSLFNASNVRVLFSDTVTVITPPTAIAPTVTINQAAGQADPTSTSPINFTVQFNEPVTGFINTDVILSGSAGATTAVVTGGPANYNVAVSGMTLGGTVIATVPANAASSIASSLPNTASTSIDNVVNFNITSCPIVTVSYTGPAVAIPDNVAAGINIPITVSGVGTIGDLNFRFDAAAVGTCDATVGNINAAVDHTFVGDLIFKLTSPTGTVRTFMARRGGTRENICNAIIDDDGSFPNVSTLTSITGSTVSGNFSPETTGTFSVFDGQNANGVWILNVSDNAGIDIGSIRRFSLIFNTECPCVVTCPANITVNNTPGLCGAIVNYTAPTTSGSCGTVTAVPAPGSTFPIGTTTVTATSSTTAATCTFTVTVVDNQLPVITCPADITLCGSQAVTFPAATATDNCSAVVTQIAGPASGTVFPIGTTIITYRAVDPAGNAVTCSFNIVINPIPNATATPVSQTVCSANPITSIAFTSAVTGATFNWTRNNTATVTGIGATGTGNITGTLTNTTNAPITVTFTITPTASGCPGSAITATVLVNPTPVVLAGGSGNLFIPGTLALADPTYNRPLSYIQGGTCALSGVATAVHYKTHTFTLTSPSNVTVSLVPADGAAITPSAADTYLQLLGPGGFTPTATCTNSIASNDDAVGSLSRIVTTTPLAAGTYTVVVSSFDNTPTGAGALPWTYTLAILLPPATVFPNQVLCNNTATNAVVFSGTVTGTTFGWTNSATSIGLAASGTGNIPAFTAINAGVAPVVGTITVTPTANGCPGPAKTFTITVNPTPAMNAVPNQIVCNGLPTTTITFGSAVTGATYAWTNSNPSIGLAASGAGNIASFNAINLGATQVVATINVIATANGCAGPSQTFTILVNPTPVVTLATFAPICRNASVLTLTGGSPTTGGTGVYFVDGFVQTVLNPANYTPGIHTIVYQFTSTAGCVNSDTKTILVHPLHVVVITVAPNTGVKPGLNATVIATVSPADNNYTYQWVKNGNINLTASTDRIDVLANDAGNYRVTVTAPTGCVVVSDNAFTASAISSQLYVFPNPNTGLFNVSFNDGGANLLGRTLCVYDAKGAKVFARTYSVNVPLGNMAVDIRNRAKGFYYVVLRDSNGKRLATATVEKL